MVVRLSHQEDRLTRPTINRGHKALITVVIVGVIAIAAIGFAGSYKAVWALADREGFGWFARVLPIGVDAGIVVLYAFELLLTWLRMPYPLLRQTAWVLTVATIIMNSASAWGNPLAMGMHAVVPVLFIIAVEAARHAVARWASLAEGKPQREVFALGRWVNAPFGTFAMWRRKHLWGITSNEDLINLEKRRQILVRLLKKKYGRRWRKQGSELAQLLLSMQRFGEGDPLLYDEALEELGVSLRPRATHSQPLGPVAHQPAIDTAPAAAIPSSRPAVGAGFSGAAEPTESSDSAIHALTQGLAEVPAGRVLPERSAPQPAAAPAPVAAISEPARTAPQPVETVSRQAAADGRPGADAEAAPLLDQEADDHLDDGEELDEAEELDGDPSGSTDGARRKKAEVYYGYYVSYVERWGNHPTKEEFVQWAYDKYGEKGQDGGPLKTGSIKRYWLGLTTAYRDEYETPQSDLLQMVGAGS